uniref:Lipocalin n=1 Tax=Rhipicephalus zambeziensis TaxID=60191 RepID=A0A224YIT1_9ACAR
MAITTNIRMFAAIIDLLISMLSFSAAAYPPDFTGSLGNFMKILNTTDRIWLYNRTYNNHGHECLYLKTESIKQLEYSFKQYYIDNKGKQHEHNLKGKLAMETKLGGASLTVTGASEDGTSIKYILLQEKLQHGCFALYFTTSAEDHKQVQRCQLYIPDSGIKEPVQDCLDLYSSYCSQYLKESTDGGQVVYSDKCQNLQGC